MNNLEKKALYSFLTIYLGSSLFFLFLSGFWYFDSQKNLLNSTIYYKLHHVADEISSSIIQAHMKHGKPFFSNLENGYSYELVPEAKKMIFKRMYFDENGYKVLVSSSVQKHLGVEFVVVKTNEYHKKLQEIKSSVALIMMIVFVVIVLISYFLAKLFMRPIQQKIQQIEHFIQDISHELNTPITALSMSAKRAMQKGVYDKKIVTNISISTKQLYSIYKSLTYLNFNVTHDEPSVLNLKPIVERTIVYYGELSSAKQITINSQLEDSMLKILESRAELLFSNLLSNAIKYSMPRTTISIVLNQSYFYIEDEGSGIEKEKLGIIFEMYKRGSNLAGGFGVGLSTVAKICHESDIKIEVFSEVAKGSRFVLTF